jgi:putative hydroxymethylpyrimidine transport system substrate-binding protein
MRSTAGRRSRRWITLQPAALAATALALVLALAGCGEATNVLTPPASAFQSLTLMLDWSPNADHVGIYQAQADGDFKRVALNVHIVYNTSDPSAPLRLLAAGKVQVAIAYEPEVLLARNQHIPLVSVAALVQRPLTAIVSLGSQHIRTPAELRGKTVGVAGIPYQTAFLQTILQHAGVPQADVKTVNVGESLVPAMLSGQVNATLGAYWNYEAIQLTQLHKHPNVIHMEQAGVPNYDELVFVVTENEIVNHPNLIRAFVQAVARGYASARADPVAAVHNLLAANPDAGLSEKLQLASVQATMPYWFPTGGKPWGWQSSSQWNAFGQWMINENLISDANAVTDASTNELLAGQGV